MKPINQDEKFTSNSPNKMPDNEQLDPDCKDDYNCDGYFSLPPSMGDKNYAPYFINNYLLGNY